MNRTYIVCVGFKKNDFIGVKQLLQNHSELCYTMEALSLQVQNFCSTILHTYTRIVIRGEIIYIA